MKILAIETSCDETAVAVLDCDGGVSSAHFSVLGNALYSQASKHSPYGGVYPALAKREHQANLGPLATEALSQAGMFKKTEKAISYKNPSLKDEAFRKNIEAFLSSLEKPDIGLIAVTHGPGLEPALWTGINFAQALSDTWNIPLLGIDHMEGHTVSALLKRENEKKYVLRSFLFPLLALLISGGHTELVLMKKWFSYEHVGRTRDDAVGEAFDKVARLLDLPYPGGPEIQSAAARSRARGGGDIEFPRPMSGDGSCDFSFSGLKTAVLYKMRSMEKLSEDDKEEIAEAFEDAARDVIVEKTGQALSLTRAKALAVGGGVSANAEIRTALENRIAKDFPETTLFFPEANMTGDNAVMIGAAAYLRASGGKMQNAPLSAQGSLSLSDES